MKNTLSSYMIVSRDNNFNLIRFIAATAVLYTHSFALALGSGWADPLENILGTGLGGIAVDVFFISSGFLIAGSFLNQKNILAFAWARILRIYPALIVAVIFCVLVGLYFTTLTFDKYIRNIDTVKFFLENIVLIFGLKFNLPGVFQLNPFPKVVNGSIWTLPIEINMYSYIALLSSLLLYVDKIFLKNFFKGEFIVIYITILIVNIYNQYYPFLDKTSLHLLCMFFSGSFFYIFKDVIIISSIVFYIMCFILTLALADKEIFFSIYNVFFAYIVIYFAYVPSGIVREFNRLGDYSYGMYIYAFPIQQSIAALIDGVSVVKMIAISFCASLFLASLSWHFIEKKCLRFKILVK